MENKTKKDMENNVCLLKYSHILFFLVQNPLFFKILFCFSLLLFRKCTYRIGAFWTVFL